MQVSVVIPCYNVEGFVERAVRSALDQNIDGLEVICVDDGSTDGTPRILDELASGSDKRISVFHGPNRGACAARNKGTERSLGSYIEFLDADDRLLPGKLSHQLDLASRHGLPDLIIGSSRTVTVDGTLLSSDVRSTGTRDIWLDLMRHRCGGSPQNLWKREAVVKAGGWSEGLASSQEYDLMFRMMQNDATVIHDPEILTEIVQRSSGSISQVNLDRNWKRFVELRVRILAYVREHFPDLDTQAHQQVVFDSIRTLYPFDPDGAVAMYRSHLPKDFEPGLSAATGKGYLLLHKIFGFALANRIRQSLFKG